MVSNIISRTARAKINLDLLITGRRADGYHLLDSLVVFTDYGDLITVSPARELSLTISGPFGEALRPEADNLVLQAARKLQEKFAVNAGAEITLVKNLPVSSGIGGGSADAAATLQALVALWGLSDHREELDGLSLTLGADVPVCMASETCHMTGIGENLAPVSIAFPLAILMVNPGVAVSTVEIFQARAREEVPFSVGRSLPVEIEDTGEFLTILAASGNDLQKAACRLAPQIDDVRVTLHAMESCLYSAMSGSGATCFGLFDRFDEAKAAERRLREERQDWWVKAAHIV